MNDRNPAVLYRHLWNGGYSDEDDFYSDHITLSRIERFACQILPYSQRCNPNLTLHDEKHSVRVITNINTIVEIIGENGVSLSETEMELLYYSAWYHDIGLLLSPNTYSHDGNDGVKHGRRSSEIIREHDLVGDSAEMTDAVCTMVESHSYGTDVVPQSVTIAGEAVRLRMLCSILCLADLCDYNKHRAQNVVYEILKHELSEEENSHWIANRSLDIQIDAKNRVILVSKISDIDCGVLLEPFEKYAPIHISNIEGLALEIVYNDVERL